MSSKLDSSSKVASTPKTKFKLSKGDIDSETASITYKAMYHRKVSEDPQTFNSNEAGKGQREERKDHGCLWDISSCASRSEGAWKAARSSCASRGKGAGKAIKAVELPGYC